MDLEKKVTNMKSISEYIDTLTEEEKEIHKNLIDECLEREQELITISNNRKELINRLENSLSFFVSCMNNLEDNSKKIIENISNIYLKVINPKNNLLN